MVYPLDLNKQKYRLPHDAYHSLSYVVEISDYQDDAPEDHLAFVDNQGDRWFVGETWFHENARPVFKPILVVDNTVPKEDV